VAQSVFSRLTFGGCLASEETTLRDDRRTSGNGGGSVHLVSALALSAATGLLRTFTATRRRRDVRDSWNAPAPGATRDAKDSAPMRGIGFLSVARGNLEASECERFAELEGCLEEGGVGTQARGQARHETRGSRAVGGAVGGRGRQWRGARPRARERDIFEEKPRCFFFNKAIRHFFPTGGSHDFGPESDLRSFFARSVFLSIKAVVELVLLFRRLLNSCARAR
jgi:hypothetical protein